MSFEHDVSIIASQREASAAQAKQRLGPTRETLVRERDEFQKRALAARPALESAQRKLMRASSVGLESATLRHLTVQAFGDGGVAPGLLAGAVSAYDDAVRQIDQLSTLALARDPHLETRLRGAPERLRGCAPALAALVKDVAHEVAKLERVLQERAASAAPLPTAVVPAPASLVEPIAEMSPLNHPEL